MCNCFKPATDICTCPTGFTLNDESKCCNTCYKTCKKTVYGEWSEWSKDKVVPSAILEVETKME